MKLLSEYKKLFDIINKAINSKRKDSYEAKVIEVLDENKRAKVQIIGGTDIFTLLNKTHEVLSKGDSVRIEAKNGDLSNGTIALRYGESIEVGGGGGNVTSVGTSDHSKLSNLDYNSSAHTGFASSAELSNHAVNSIIHITAADREKWDTGTGGTGGPAVIDNLTSTSTSSALSANQGRVLNTNLNNHTSNNTIHVSSTDRTKWDAGGTPDWVNITNKPSTFPPSVHIHAQSDITNLNSTLTTKANQTDLTNHTDNNDIHVNSADRAKWDSGISLEQLNNHEELEATEDILGHVKMGDLIALGIKEAPIDNEVYGRYNKTWEKAVSKNYFDNLIGSFTEPLLDRLKGIIDFSKFEIGENSQNIIKTDMSIQFLTVNTFVEEAPADDNIYGRTNASWTKIVNTEYVDTVVNLFMDSLEARLNGVI